MCAVGLNFGSPTSGTGFDVSATVARIVGNLQNVETPWKTPLKKLNTSLMKLPRNITAAQVSDLDGRLKALSARVGQAGLPKGPMPAGAKQRNVQRAARRR